jgi:hypothetical protein
VAEPYLPPDWPADVRPPDTDDFERTTVNWLFDHCPPDFRAYETLRRHPRLLARLAVEQLRSALEACRAGYRTARADLKGGDLNGVDARVLDELLAVYEHEGRRLAAAVRSAELLAAALRGERFTRPL